MESASHGTMFSHCLTVAQVNTSAASPSQSSLTARRRFFGVGVQQQQQQHRQQQQQKQKQQQQSLQLQQYNLHVPSSVHCPDELSPIGSALGDFVPFADALRSVRNRCLPSVVEFGDSQDDFEWLDQANNSSGESSSRKVAAKERAKREIDNYFFMYFRIRMENFVALVTALKQSSRNESIFNEENLDRWTHKFKFKMRRAAPLKKALMAFSCRMGLEDDPDVMYCIDGFYGDAFAGRTFNKNEVPNNRVQPANTSMASRLRNGSNIFVSRINNTERKNAIAQLQMDLAKGNESSDEEADDETQGTLEQKSEESGGQT